MKLGRFFAISLLITGLFLSVNAFAGCSLAGSDSNDTKDSAVWDEKTAAGTKNPSIANAVKTDVAEKDTKAPAGNEE